MPKAFLSRHLFCVWRRGTDISDKVGLAHPDDAQGYILSMVEAGEICAQIASPAGTVHFREDTNTLSSATMTARLEADLRSTAELTERVRKLEARLIVNPVFVQKASSMAFYFNVFPLSCSPLLSEHQVVDGNIANMAHGLTGHPLPWLTVLVSQVCLVVRVGAAAFLLL